MSFIKDPVVLALIDPKCTEETFRKHAEDSFFLIRALVALGTRDGSLLLQLFQDNDVSVLSAVAGNSYTSIQIANDLAQHPDEVVRCGAAMHPRLLPDIYRRLLADPSQMVKDAAKRNTVMADAIKE